MDRYLDICGTVRVIINRIVSRSNDRVSLLFHLLLQSGTGRAIAHNTHVEPAVYQEQGHVLATLFPCECEVRSTISRNNPERYPSLWTFEYSLKYHQ